MLIAVKDIPIVGQHYALEMECTALELELKCLSPVLFTGHIYRSNDDIRVDGNVKTRIQMNCGRCLDDFAFDIDNNFEIYYRPYPSGTSSHAPKDQEKDLGILHYRNGVIDLGMAVRDTIILELPIKRLCREDCLGLCLVCGGNRNHTNCHCQQEKKSYNPFEEFFNH